MATSAEVRNGKGRVRFSTDFCEKLNFAGPQNGCNFASGKGYGPP
jgi:hypothetical protein